MHYISNSWTPPVVSLQLLETQEEGVPLRSNHCSFSEMDGVCQVESVRRSLSDVEAEHEDLDWDSFTTSVPLHQVLRVCVCVCSPDNACLWCRLPQSHGFDSQRTPTCECLPSLHC